MKAFICAVLARVEAELRYDDDRGLGLGWCVDSSYEELGVPLSENEDFK